MVPVAELEAIKTRIQDELLTKPGVTGLMIGEREEENEVLNQNPCLIVMIRQDMGFYKNIGLLWDVIVFMEEHNVPLNFIAIKPCSPTAL